MEKLLVATVLKPHGIKGEMKIKFFADDFSSIAKIKTFYIDNKEYSVTSLKYDGQDFAFLHLLGVEDRDVAESLRNASLFADKSSIRKSKTSFFIADLIGLQVIINGEVFGTIEDVIKSNVDMFNILKTDGKRAYLPYLKSLNFDIDIENKTLKIKGEDYEKVIFYES